MQKKKSNDVKKNDMYFWKATNFQTTIILKVSSKILAEK